MRRRVGGYFFLVSGRNDRIAGGITMALGMIVAFFAPPPHVTIVDGKEVREMVIAGNVIPSWMAILMLTAVVGLVFSGIRAVLNALWSEDRPSKKHATRVAEVLKRIDGLNWQPDTPGTASPMDYAPKTLSANASSRDYLTCSPPPEMHAIFGNEEYQLEYGEHLERLDKWLASAPLEVLEDLLPTAEEILAEPPLDRVVLDHLIFACRRRQIPTPGAIMAMADRLGDLEILDYSRFDLPD